MNLISLKMYDKFYQYYSLEIAMEKLKNYFTESQVAQQSRFLLIQCFEVINEFM